MLTENALAVYRHVVANPDADASTIAFDLGLADDQLLKARGELVDAGLVLTTAQPDSRMVALAPEVALSGAVYDDERNVRELQARITAQRANYLTLVPYYTEARGHVSRPAEVQVLDEMSTIREFLADTCRDTRHELLIAHPTRHLSATSLNEGLPQDLEMLGRGVVRRSIYLKSNRDSVAVQRAVARVMDAGAEVRVLPVIPLRVMCFDGSIAMLSRSQSADDKAAIVVRDTNLVRTVRLLFLAAWDSAEPFLQDDCGNDGPSHLDLAILEGLATGLSDEQIARRQDISVRTCRRHIHDLTERLGAQSRFQAGAMAAKRNWI